MSLSLIRYQTAVCCKSLTTITSFSPSVQLYVFHFRGVPTRNLFALAICQIVVITSQSESVHSLRNHIEYRTTHVKHRSVVPSPPSRQHLADQCVYVYLIESPLLFSGHVSWIGTVSRQLLWFRVPTGCPSGPNVDHGGFESVEK